jgi:hypothetical protein
LPIRSEIQPVKIWTNQVDSFKTTFQLYTESLCFTKPVISETQDIQVRELRVTPVTASEKVQVTTKVFQVVQLSGAVKEIIGFVISL